MDKTLISEAFGKAPAALQNYLKSSDFEKDVLGATTELGLPVTGFLPLKNYTMLVFLNLSDDTLISKLGDALRINKTELATVVDKIDSLTLAIVQRIIGEAIPETVKQIKLSSDASIGGDLRANMLTQKQTATQKGEAVVQAKPVNTSRTMLMDQLSLIGQIPKDEDVLARLSKIKEQLRKGEVEKEKLDEEIKQREEVEKIKSLEVRNSHVPRKVYDIDPYREHVEEEDANL